MPLTHAAQVSHSPHHDMDVSKSAIGDLIVEGKTKQVFALNSNSKHVYVRNKDRITAGDGVKAHQMTGKAKLSTRTNGAVFEFLKQVGVRTHFVSHVSESSPDSEISFIALKCDMIPIEWVTRRVATGSYLKRNPHVTEGYRFYPPKLETFFKDDANHDPYWSIETLIEAKLKCGDLTIGRTHVEEMLAVTQLVFELLERSWQTVDHSLIDMKIEFGVTPDNEIVVADVIDNDSWRLWPSGDKRLMLDKQVYRNMDATSIDDAAIQKVRSNFQIVADRTHSLFTGLLPEQKASTPVVGILMGSTSDLPFAQKIRTKLECYGIPNVEVHVCSAHKSTKYTLDVISSLIQWPSCKVIVALAGRSNGLGPVAAANCPIPVINCPPTTDVSVLELDIWSSLRLPSGTACPTILGAENGAQSAAHIVANSDAFVWAKLRTQQTSAIVNMIRDDDNLVA